MPRPVDLVVISDVHLGTPTCKAAELNAYLKSIDPQRVILLGDIIDFWEFRRGWWPVAHTKVVRRILKFATAGIPVHFITGNHDAALRRYAPFALGDLQLSDRLILEVGGVRTLFIHGDQVDLRIGTSRFTTWLGCCCYDGVTALTDHANAVRRLLGLRPWVNPTARFKATWAAGHIARFERAVAHYAAEEGFASVVCGHIHVAREQVIDGVAYRNDGDWVDSLTALEFANGAWTLQRYADLVRDQHLDPPQDLSDTVGLVPAIAS